MATRYRADQTLSGHFILTPDPMAAAPVVPGGIFLFTEDTVLNTKPNSITTVAASLFPEADFDKNSYRFYDAAGTLGIYAGDAGGGNILIVTITDAPQGMTRTARGPIDANTSLEVDMGDYTFKITKNVTGSNVGLATGWITKKDPSVQVMCFMSWQSAWVSSGQWYSYDWYTSADPVATDTDLGYGNDPTRGGSHVVRLMERESHKMWTITCMIGGNQDGQADFASISVDMSCAQD